MRDKLLEVGDRRLASMDDAGLDVQVISLTAPGLHNVAAEEATHLQVDTNDHIASLVLGNPGRFQGFATLAMTAPEAAAHELERAVTKVGLNGAMLFGRTGSRNLEIDNAFATYGIGWHYESGVQFLRLAHAGVFDRFPELQVVLGHWGEVGLFALDRADSLAAQAKLGRSSSEYVRQNASITAGGVHSERYPRWALDIAGVERLMFGTDYPYRPGPAGGVEGFLERAGLDPVDQERVTAGNWDGLVAGINR
jgi:predicted TIM-barrel fold metal-dependent hydrolase